MGPERLAGVRARLRVGSLAPFDYVIVKDLLADRDHWEAEARRWRAECPVTAEDIERARVATGAGGAAYAVAMRCGWVYEGHDHVSSPSEPEECYDTDDAEQVSELVRVIARDTERSPHDILDEMAAEVSP